MEAKQKLKIAKFLMSLISLFILTYISSQKQTDFFLIPAKIAVYLTH